MPEGMHVVAVFQSSSEISQAGTANDRPRLLVVSISAMGTESCGREIESYGSGRSDVAIDLLLAGTGPRPNGRLVQARKPFWRYATANQAWRMRRRAFEATANLIAERYDGVLFLSVNPAFALAPSLTAHGCPYGIYVDATIDNHAEQHSWRRSTLVEREADRHRAIFNGAVVTAGRSRWCAHAINSYFVPAEPALTVLPGVRLAESGAVSPRTVLHGPARLGLVGSPWFRKGFDRVARWLAARPRAHVEVRVYGDHGFVSDDSRWVNYGHVPRDQLIPNEMAKLDVLVNPTRSDQSAWSVVEAASCGIPSIASRVGGISDLVRPGSTGWLVQCDSEAALASALDEAVHDRTRTRQMGTAARDLANECFTPRNYAPLIDRLLSARVRTSSVR